MGASLIAADYQCGNEPVLCILAARPVGYGDDDRRAGVMFVGSANPHLLRWRHQRNTRGGVVLVDGHAAGLNRTESLFRIFNTAY